MKKNFCYICGKQAKISGLCKPCFVKQNKLSEISTDFEIIRCCKCKLIKFGANWTKFNAEKFFKSKLKIKGKLLSFKAIRLKSNKKNINEYFKVSCTGCPNDSDVQKNETHEIHIHWNIRICPRCAMILTGYYEAIIQLRGNVTKSILDFIENELDKCKNKMAFYRIKKIKSGFDIYIGTKQYAKSVAELLKKKYKLKLTYSYKLVTRRDGKDLYRTNVCIRV